MFNATPVTVGNNTISGFNVANDVLQLSAAIYSGYAAASAAIAADPRNAGTLSGTYIKLDANDSIYLAGVRPNQLTASDFTFA